MSNSKVLENNHLETIDILNFEPHELLTKDYFFKWLIKLNLDNSESAEHWANQFLPEFCELLNAKAGLFYTYQEKRRKCKLLAHHQAIISDELPRDIKLNQSNLMSVLYSPQILQIQVNSLSVFYHAGKEYQQDMMLFIPIFKEGVVIAYFELLLNEILDKDYLTFINKLIPFLAESLGKIQNETKYQKRVQELESINQAMEASQEAMHENAVKFMRIHQKLTDSINYAQKMQKAILPQEEILAKIFEEVFIIYEPKDTVSGDFYWYSQIDYTFLAVIDCTGHGVPGAFMSMIGNTLLNEIVNSKRVYEPAKILEMLHKGVRTSLNQGQSQNIDGMEICLCRFTRDQDFNMVLTFAGAKRPLYYVRNNEIHKIPGTRRSIGGVIQDNPDDFENHTITLEEGDILYLSTDGYKDAPNNKRKSLGINMMKNTILENASLPLSKQKEALWNTLIEYQEGTPIRDDITLIGLKV